MRSEHPIEKAATVSELEKSIAFPKQADNFHDASELILISQQLKEYNSPIFKSTLAKAVNVPTSLEAERAKSSDARNRIFELVMAAAFRAAGIPLKFVEPADAIITVDNIKCFVKCKRIQTEKALEEPVRQASSQIEKRLNQEASVKPRGLIAIDISKNSEHGRNTVFRHTFSRLFKQVDRQQPRGFLDSEPHEAHFTS
jgi:hypothetical protein